ncbi:hypothetical protein TNCV_511571 [Trichonephila clavipes]|nr:hypothetical protein TNCV_511571 [Trichonephila clavipes]
MFSTDHEEYRKLKHFLETDKDFEFYILKRQKDKPIKAVIKGLPNSALITDITNDLNLIGFNIDSCTQLISKRTKKSLPYFLITLPRNDLNSKIFDIKKLGYLQSLSISKYMISILKAHCHPPINDRSIANASCTAIGPPPPKSRPSLQAQVSKTKKIRVPDRG